MSNVQDDLRNNKLTESGLMVQFVLATVSLPGSSRLQQPSTGCDSSGMTRGGLERIVVVEA